MAERRNYLDHIQQRLILVRTIKEKFNETDEVVYKVVRATNYIPKDEFYHYNEIEDLKEQGVEVNILYKNKMKLRKLTPNENETQVFLRRIKEPGSKARYYVEKTKNIVLPSNSFEFSELESLNDLNIYLEINFIKGN